jgi:NAD(P)-dependent dehydrogenase (short-subunit alcohol dehydrogenase family)
VKADLASLFSLEKKTVVLTGASGFLGRVFAEALLSSGARVIALGRSQRLLELQEEWTSKFGADRVGGCRVDMYDLPKFTQVLERIAGEEKRIDVLVNNAHELGPATGFNTPAGSLEQCSMEQWMSNLTGGVCWSVLTTQRLGSMMKAHGGGSIINVSTMYALVAPSPDLYEGTEFLNPPGYSASKAALLSFTRYVASFWGKYGIRANALVPGPFSNTDYQGPNAVQADSPFLERLRARTCFKRIGRPQELVGALLFLASDASSFMTGQTLVIDGGWTVT